MAVGTQATENMKSIQTINNPHDQVTHIVLHKQ